MRLQRMRTLSEFNCEQEEVDWACSGEDASIRIDNFGNGPDRQSDFKIVLTWEDVMKVISGMAAQNHEGALKTCRAVALARAVRNLFEDSD